MILGVVIPPDRSLLLKPRAEVGVLEDIGVIYVVYLGVSFDGMIYLPGLVTT